MTQSKCIPSLTTQYRLQTNLLTICPFELLLIFLVGRKDKGSHSCRSLLRDKNDTVGSRFLPSELPHLE